MNNGLILSRKLRQRLSLLFVSNRLYRLSTSTCKGSSQTDVPNIVNNFSINEISDSTSSNKFSLCKFEVDPTLKSSQKKKRRYVRKLCKNFTKIQLRKLPQEEEMCIVGWVMFLPLILVSYKV